MCIIGKGDPSPIVRKLLCEKESTRRAIWSFKAEVVTEHNCAWEELVAVRAAQRWGEKLHGHVVKFREFLIETFLVSQELDVGEVC